MSELILNLKENTDAYYELEGNGELLIYTNVSPEEYEEYQERLIASGRLTPYAAAEMGKNRSHTYLFGDRFLHTYYIAATRTARVIVEFQKGKFDGLPPQSEEPHDVVCEPSFTVMALDYTVQRYLDANGMSYVFLLEDGSFVIYDGGYLEDAKPLYAYLRDHSPLPDGKIVISAWIQTHSHWDHFSCFLGFTRMYADRVDVKYFVLNAPQRDESIIDVARHNDFLNKDFFECVKKYPNARILRVHTGQKIMLPGMEMEVLQTYEDVLPQRMDWLNEASLVTRVKIKGQTFLFSSDCELKGDEALVRYGKYLKSDFLQVTHHGYSGGTIALIDAIDPKYLMWTTNFECYSQRIMPMGHNSVNRYLLQCKSVKCSFVGDGACKILKLPFEHIKNVEYYHYSE